MSAKERKPVLLRLDPAVHDAVARWAADELRSTNAHVEYLLRRALLQAGRLPRDQRADPDALPKRGRPPKDPRGSEPDETGADPEQETT